MKNEEWSLVVRKQADFTIIKELNPDDFIEVRINSAQVTEKAVTVTLRKLVDMLENVEPIR